MYRTTIEFHNRMARGEIPVAYILVDTAMGWCAIGEKVLRNLFDADTTYLADGSYTADGSIHAGSDSYGLIDVQGRLLELSGLERTISPKTANVLTAMTTKQLRHIRATCNNTDRYYTKILPTQPFLGRTLAAYLGFEDIPFAEHRCQFTGTIAKIAISGNKITFEADEQ